MRKNSVQESGGVVYAPYRKDDKIAASTEGFPVSNCPEGADGRGGGPRPLSWTVVPWEDGQEISIFLNTGFISPKLINELVNLLVTVTEKDALFIHLPCNLYLDDAEFIASAISLCKAKTVKMSAPYILDSATAYLMTFADQIVASRCGIVRIGLPEISAYGKVTDADNALRANKYRILHILTKLRRAGFIASDEEFLHIVKRQGTICIHGKRLTELVAKINATSSPVDDD